MPRRVGWQRAGESFVINYGRSMDLFVNILIAAAIVTPLALLIAIPIRAVSRKGYSFDLEKRFARSGVAGWEYRPSWVSTAGMICFGIFWVLEYTSRLDFRGVFLVLGIVFAFTDLISIRPRRYRAFFKNLRESDYKVCTKCLYSLIGSPATGVCPECGTSYTYDTLRNEWISIARKNRVMLPKLSSEDRTREP